MTTPFNKILFNLHAGYLTYDGRFVARFKYRGPFTAAKVRRELIDNYTVEEYFAAMDSGETPLGFLKANSPDWYSGIMDKAREKASRTQAKYVHNTNAKFVVV